MVSPDIRYMYIGLQNIKFVTGGEIVTCGDVLKLGGLGHAPPGKF